MIDIHCHILPDIDDGASDLEESLEMARMAWLSGVTDIATTPHFQGQMESVELREVIDQRLTLLRTALKEENIPLRLHSGAEILCLPETPELAARQLLPTLGSTRYVLTEFYFDESFAFMDDILSEIAACGYRIVVAHPERYEAIIRDPRGAERWFRRGYLIQLNKGSILGAFGGRVQAASRWLLDGGLVHMIASDAHSPRKRTTDLSLLRSWLLERYPEGYVRLLLEENPGRLLRNEGMVPTENH
jgi:protein-tyrosine phosphatase